MVRLDVLVQAPCRRHSECKLDCWIKTSIGLVLLKAPRAQSGTLMGAGAQPCWASGCDQVLGIPILTCSPGPAQPSSPSLQDWLEGIPGAPSDVTPPKTQPEEFFTAQGGSQDPETSSLHGEPGA